MSKDNPNSPIHNFGHNITRKAEIDSVDLVKLEPKGFFDKAVGFLSHKIPNQAEVRFTAISKISDTRQGKSEKSKERFLAKIGFSFDSIDVDKDEKVHFIVADYQLFKIK